MLPLPLGWYNYTINQTHCQYTARSNGCFKGGLLADASLLRRAVRERAPDGFGLKSNLSRALWARELCSMPQYVGKKNRPPLRWSIFLYRGYEKDIFVFYY